jgi:hypothetical protein
MRDRLIEIIKKVPYGVGVGAKFEQHFCEKVADCLLENGVIVPPVKVGDTIYVVDVCATQIIKRQVTGIGQSEWGTIHIHSFGFRYPESSVGKIVFLTKEQAEKALAEVANGT